MAVGVVGVVSGVAVTASVVLGVAEVGLRRAEREGPWCRRKSACARRRSCRRRAGGLTSREEYSNLGGGGVLVLVPCGGGVEEVTLVGGDGRRVRSMDWVAG